MSRTNVGWKVGITGTYVETTGPGGYDLLINGSNHYLNFNTTVGSSGYGIRDNGGTMEFKDSGGAWTSFAGSAAGVSSINGLTGAITLAAGTGISLTPVGNTITIAATGGGGTPGGLTTQLQYNNAGSFGGISGATTNGTVVTLTAPAVATSLTASYATASTIAIFDGSKNIISADTATYPSLTELTYVKGVTSAIQTQINGKQPLDATLTALAAYNTNGLLTQTAADTFTGRTITGTASQITVTNGDGVAGNPTLSLPADVLIPTILTVPNTGLHLLDTNASHDLIIKPGSNITADRTFTITTGDTDMIVDFTAVTDEFVLAYDTSTNTWRGVVSAGGGITVGDTQVVFADGANTPAGDAGFTYNKTTDTAILTGGVQLGGTTTAFGAVAWNTTQTVDTNMLLTGTTSNHWVMAESADSGFDFAHAQATDPTLFIHSHNQSTTQWVGFKHDGTNAVVSTGAGLLSLTSAGNQVAFPAGTSSLPGIAFTGDLNSGFTNVADTYIGVIMNAGFIMAWLGSQINVYTPIQPGSADAAAGVYVGVTNTRFDRGYFKTQLGGTDGANEAGATLTFKGNDGVTGTDLAGGAIVLAAGKGTGTGVGADFVVQTAKPLATGTTVQTLGDRQRVLQKYTTLTESTATAFASVTVATGIVSGGVIEYTVEANDGTDFQSLSGMCVYSIVNKGGTSTIVLGTDQQASSTSTGTLTGTLTAVDAGSGVIQFKMNAVSSLTQTVLRINAQVRKNFGTGQILAI